MEKEKQMIVRFTGDNYVLHKELKKKCVEAEVSMNDTIIKLIKKHLKK